MSCIYNKNCDCNIKYEIQLPHVFLKHASMNIVHFFKEIPVPAPAVTCLLTNIIMKLKNKLKYTGSINPAAYSVVIMTFALLTLLHYVPSRLWYLPNFF